LHATSLPPPKGIIFIELVNNKLMVKNVVRNNFKDFSSIGNASYTKSLQLFYNTKNWFLLANLLRKIDEFLAKVVELSRLLNFADNIDMYGNRWCLSENKLIRTKVIELSLINNLSLIPVKID
jgi:hypothetical protein